MRNRYYITATLETKALMRIGTGEYEANSSEDSLISPLLLADGKPYIPATTLKGVWKERVDIKLDGKMIIYDAVCETKIEETHVQSTEIDRETRTAKYGSLRTINYLPQGTKFPIEILLENSNAEEVGDLCAAISGTLYLGGNKSNGFGECKISDISCFYMDSNTFNTWLETGTNGFFTEISNHSIPTPFGNSPAPSSLYETLDITLKFISPFLVADKVKDKKTGDPDLIPLKKGEDCVLPASSFRGALRSQAERINETVEKCKYKHSIQRIFGDKKKQARLQFTDFIAEGTKATYNMIAIDRFSGGVKDGSTFSIQVLEEATLKGSITFKGNFTNKDYVLLGHLFRDLHDGDITLGYGATKGFGVCKICNYKEIMKKLEVKSNG